MKAAFNDEHNRGKKVYHAITGLAQHCEPIAQVASGVALTLEESDVFVEKSFHHDTETVLLDLQEEHLTQRFIDLRSSAHHLIRGMPAEGPNSDILPQMDYKRAMDRSSASSETNETQPPPSGSAPSNNG